MAYSKQTWTNGEGGGTPLSAARLAHLEDGVFNATNPVGATANDVVESSKVAGDTTNRYERRADGSIVIGPGGTEPLRSGEAFLVIDLGAGDKEGIRIYGPSDALNQIQTWFDHLGAPIFTIPVDGGPAVLGDSFRVFGQGEIFNPRHKLHHDGSVSFNKGDAAGSVGGVAIGATTTAPTRAPDGSGNDGTIGGVVLAVDANGRIRVRRSTGSEDLVGGSNQSFFPPTGGIVGGDHWFNSVSASLNFYNGSTWRRVAVDIDAKRVISANYSVVNADDYGVILHSAAATAVTITLPSDATANALPTESPIRWRQWGAGQITFAAGTGATVLGRGGFLKSAGQYAEGTVTKVDVNTWLVSGDTVA